MSFLRMAANERARPIELLGSSVPPLPPAIAKRISERLSADPAESVVESVAKCDATGGGDASSAFVLVSKLLNLAQRVSVGAPDITRERLAFIAKSLGSACEQKPPTRHELMQYAYTLVIMLESFTDDETVRDMFDAIHGALSSDNVKLDAKWKTQRGDAGYMAEMTDRLRAYFATQPDTKLSCAKMGCEGIEGSLALNPPQRVIEYLISAQGPQGPIDQRMLVCMRPGLGKSIVALTAFYNYFDPNKKRRMMLCASSDELLSNIRAEDAKVGANGILKKWDARLMAEKNIVFCDFRYSNVIPPGPKDYVYTNGDVSVPTVEDAWEAIKQPARRTPPPGFERTVGEMPVGIHHVSVQAVLKDPEAVIVIDEAHDLFDLDDKSAVNRAGNSNPFAKEFAYEFLGMLEKSEARVVVCLTGTPFSDEPPRPPGSASGAEGVTNESNELTRSSPVFMPPPDQSSEDVGADDSDDARPEKGLDDGALGGDELGDDELGDDELGDGELGDGAPLGDDELRDDGLDDDELGLGSETDLNADGPADGPADDLKPPAGRPDKMPTTFRRSSFPRRNALGARWVRPDVSHLPSGGLTERGDALLRMLSRGGAPSMWVGGVLAANYYSGAQTFLELSPPLGTLPLLKGRAISRSVDVIQVNLDDLPEKKDKGVKFDGPDKRFLAKQREVGEKTEAADGTPSYHIVDPKVFTRACRLTNVPYLVNRGEGRNAFDTAALKEPERLIPKLHAAVEAVLRARRGYDILDAVAGPVVFETILPPEECVAAQGLVRYRLNSQTQAPMFKTVRELDGVVANAVTDFGADGKQKRQVTVILDQHAAEVFDEVDVQETDTLYMYGEQSDETPLREGSIIVLPLVSRSGKTVAIRNRLVASPQPIRLACDRQMSTERPQAAQGEPPLDIRRIEPYKETKPAGASSQTYFSYEHKDADGTVTTYYFRNSPQGSYRPRQLVMISADEGYKLFEQLLYQTFVEQAVRDHEAKEKEKAGAEGGTAADAKERARRVEEVRERAEEDIRRAVVTLFTQPDAGSSERAAAIQAFEKRFNGSYAEVADEPVETIRVGARAVDRLVADADIALVEASKFSTGLDVTGPTPKGNARPLGCSYIHHVTDCTSAVQYMQRTLRVSRFCLRRYGRICRVVMYQLVGGDSAIGECAHRAREQLNESMAQLFGGSGDQIGLLQRFDALSVDSGISDLMTSTGASAVLAGGTFLRRSYYPKLGHLGGIDEALMQMFVDFVSELNETCLAQMNAVRHTPCISHAKDTCPTMACAPGEGAFPCVRRLEGSVCTDLMQSFGAFASWMQSLSATKMARMIVPTPLAQKLWNKLVSSGAVTPSPSDAFAVTLRWEEDSAKQIIWMADVLRREIRLSLRSSLSEDAPELAWLAVALLGERWLSMMSPVHLLNSNSLSTFPHLCAGLLVMLYGIGQRLKDQRSFGTRFTDGMKSRTRHMLEKLSQSALKHRAAVLSAGVLTGAGIAAAVSRPSGLRVAGARAGKGAAAGASVATALLSTASAQAARSPLPSVREGETTETHYVPASDRSLSDATLLSQYKNELGEAIAGSPTAFEWATDPAHLFVPILSVQLFALKSQVTREL